MVREFVTVKGNVVRVLPTDEPFKFRVEKNGKPWNPMDMVENAKK